MTLLEYDLIYDPTLHIRCALCKDRQTPNSLTPTSPVLQVLSLAARLKSNQGPRINCRLPNSMLASRQGDKLGCEIERSDAEDDIFCAIRLSNVSPRVRWKRKSTCSPAKPKYGFKLLQYWIQVLGPHVSRFPSPVPTISPLYKQPDLSLSYRAEFLSSHQVTSMDLSYAESQVSST